MADPDASEEVEKSNFITDLTKVTTSTKVVSLSGLKYFYK